MVDKNSDFAIEVSSLTKKFGDFTAVNSISFKVRRGKVFAFLGPNGAGKTTTIKMLTTLLKPSSGKILVNSHDPMKNQNEVRESFGIIFQDPSLDDELTAYENMDFHGVLYKLSSRTRKERIKEMLGFIELWDRRNSRIKTFSGGMKRRLEIARGLIHHPKILFLDEPTLGLDPQTRNHIWSYIKNLNKKKGLTVFFTTHYMEEAEKMADQIAVIDRGEIIASGRADELKKKTGKKSLEEAFLKLTGRHIREEEADGKDNMRMRRRLWRR